MGNTSKHTPGPWGVRQEATERGCPLEVIATKCVVAKVYDHHEGAANANLIAAAPAMYIELKEGLVLLEASHHDMVDMYGIDSLQAKTVWERIESTRNVIAQAEGEDHK